MDSRDKILIVDDEENIRWVFQKALEKKELEVHTAVSGEDALDRIRTHDYLLVFSDIFLGEMSGLDLLERAREIAPHLKIVVMTAQDTMNNTIEAMRLGAYDYISKPFDFDEVYHLVDKVMEIKKFHAPQAEMPPEEAPDFTVEAIIGKSKKMQAVFKSIGKLAATDLAVLITGETGTGKEMVARALHYYSERNGRPFICINCAAIARELLESELFGHEKGSFTGAVEQKKGKFELADGGTLFLDEIGDMEPGLQAKILRVLQSHEFYRVGGRDPLRVDVRIIAATHQDLEELIARKQFREDLFHRLNVTHIHMPPLRDRLEDVPLLTQHFLRRNARSLTRGQVYLSLEAEERLKNYVWPGNIRELENVIKRSLVLALSGPILPEHLPDHIQNASAEPISFEIDWENQLNALIRKYLAQYDSQENGQLHDRLVQRVEKHLLEILLEKYAGKQVPTAKALGINRNTLKRKIDALKIQIKKRKSAPDPEIEEKA